MRPRVARAVGLARRSHRVPDSVAEVQAQIGDLESRWVAGFRADEIDRAEFRVFSQFGEDGIIQFLVQRVPIDRRVFVEFGVEDYRESNTRFLLVHDNWRGLILDAGTTHRRSSKTPARLAHDVDALTAFIDRDNINDVIRRGRNRGRHRPALDRHRRQRLLGARRDRRRRPADPRRRVQQHLRSGARRHRAVRPALRPRVRSTTRTSTGERRWRRSLKPPSGRARARGSNRAGNNAFFVRRDVLGDIPERGVADCWRPAQFRESRGTDGELTYLSDDGEKLRLLRDLPLVDLDGDGAERTVGELYGV